MFVLDTDVCGDFMKRTHPALIEWLRGFAPRELKISVVTLFELEFGVRRSERRDQRLRVETHERVSD